MRKNIARSHLIALQQLRFNRQFLALVSSVLARRAHSLAVRRIQTNTLHIRRTASRVRPTKFNAKRYNRLQ